MTGRGHLTEVQIEGLKSWNVFWNELQKAVGYADMYKARRAARAIFLKGYYDGSVDMALVAGSQIMKKTMRNINKLKK